MWYGVVNEDINKDMVCSKSLKSCCVGDVRTCARVRIVKKYFDMHWFTTEENCLNILLNIILA